MNGLNTLLTMVFLIAGIAIGVAGFYFYLTLRNKSLTERANQIIEEAKKKSEEILREASLKAREEAAKLREEVENELKLRRNEIQRLEERILKREEDLDQRIKEAEESRMMALALKQESEKLKQEAEEILEKQLKELERISGLTMEQAKEIVLEKAREEARLEAAKIFKEEEERALQEADKKAKEIISTAIQRYASDLAAETTVSVVTLPSDDMKGRIIGREGRNIRTFENLTGINLIIDDTPEAVTLSSFDPIRREIAKRTLEKLILDGRIHPARIEEIYEKVKEEIEEEFKEVGEEAVFELGLSGIHPEIVRLLGRLKFRTSYGQNVLQHSIEVAYIASIMADELGLDSKLARRAGLLHDIGKAVDHEIQGSHDKIGSEIARKYRESEVVINAIEAHHGLAPFTSIESVLVQAADAISASRPGARRETLESYIRRLEQLEKIASSFKGVEKCYAMQAGREVRVIVKPDEISDEEAEIIARELAKKIESEMEYPGQIKVTVIRERRAVEYAK
ncbi:MAG: ribonuclease Y [Actinobacteria bacterium]|nr:ribonuclease Y [Actinomycetota bacterium]